MLDTLTESEPLARPDGGRVVRGRAHGPPAQARPAAADDLQRWRPLMLSIARRMVGNAVDAEDLTQEAYLRFCAMPPTDLRTLKPFLSLIVRRLCLNHLKSARWKREYPVGDEWPQGEAAFPGGSSPLAETRLLELGETAAAVLLERLTPQERAVYVLHDLLAYEHDELTGLLPVSEAACWQLLHRAREHLARGVVRFERSPEMHRRLAGPLLRACSGRDLDSLVHLLVHDFRLATLPRPSGPLVGRHDELSLACRMLELADVRLLTLVGAPGVGKTHLGLEVAARLLETFEHGAHYIALAEVRDPRLVGEIVARRVGARPASGSTGHGSLEALIEHLGARETLLVLDNLEHLIEAAPLISQLLQAAPGLKVLVTSREPLRVPGERCLRVAPLTVPAPRRTPRVGWLARHAAVRLFVARAAAAREGFALTGENASAVAEICRRLDGLPLALELVASHLHRFSPEALLERLDSRTSPLEASRRSRPSGRRTLRDSLDWSYGLLELEERQLFALMGVFAGGCTLEALSAVSGVTCERVAALVDKSLVQQHLGVTGERYHLLETVRTYAMERLAASGGLHAARAAHARYFLGFAERARAASVDAGQQEWLCRLEEELANLRAALAWALEEGNVELAARLGGAMWWFWFFHGHTGEGAHWLEAALAGDGDMPPPVRAEALLGLAMMLFRRAPVDRVRCLLEACLSLQRAADNRVGVARALTNLAVVERDAGAFDRAAVVLEEALELWRALGHELGEAHALTYLALVTRDVGALDRAAQVVEEGVSLARRSGTPATLAAILALQGNIRTLRHELAGAQEAYREALDLNRLLKHDEGTGLCLYGLGMLALEEGNAARAGRLLRRALIVRRSTGNPLLNVETLEALGVVAARTGRHAEAARLLAMGARQRQVNRMPVPPVDRALDAATVETVRLALGEATFQACWEEGSALSIEQAIDVLAP